MKSPLIHNTLAKPAIVAKYNNYVYINIFIVYKWWTHIILYWESKTKYPKKIAYNRTLISLIFTHIHFSGLKKEDEQTNWSDEDLVY